MRRWLLVAALAVAAPAACRSEQAPYVETGDRAWGLRAAFNADAGRVRVIVLVSPT